MRNDNSIPIKSDRDLLIKLATDVENIKNTLEELKENIRSFNCEYDERISRLEQWRAYVIGASAIIALTISILFSIWRWFLGATIGR